MRLKLVTGIMLTLLLMSILMLAFNFKSVTANPQPTATTKLSISPGSIIGPPPNIGENFTIDIYVENVVNFTGWQIGLAWNASVLQCLSFMPQFGTGTFLGPPSDWLGFDGTINNTIGEVFPPYAYTFFGAGAPPNGSGTIAQVQFQVSDCGFTWINLTNIMIESNRVVIPVDVINSTFTLFPVHDVTVTSVTLSATEAYPTWVKPLYINVTVKNNGTTAENFTVTAYYNNTAIDTQTVNNLPCTDETTLTFTWNIPDIPKAYPYPVYTISANASVVPGEINATNNHLSDGAVTVRWPGDAIGDGHINLLDLSLMADHWLSIPTYNPRVDFNIDGNIDLLDHSILEDNWFEGPLD